MEDLTGEKKAAFQAAQDEFSTTVSGNWTMTALIVRALDANPMAVGLSPDQVMVDPTYGRNRDGTIAVGVRISRSIARTPKEAPMITVDAQWYDYIDLFTLTTDEGGDTTAVAADKSLVEAVTAMQDDQLPREQRESSVDAEINALWKCWSAAWTSLVGKFAPGELAINPMGGVPILRSELERQSFFGFPTE